MDPLLFIPIVVVTGCLVLYGLVRRTGEAQQVLVQHVAECHGLAFDSESGVASGLVEGVALEVRCGNGAGWGNLDGFEVRAAIPGCGVSLRWEPVLSRGGGDPEVGDPDFDRAVRIGVRAQTDLARLDWGARVVCKRALKLGAVLQNDCWVLRWPSDEQTGLQLLEKVSTVLSAARALAADDDVADLLLHNVRHDLVDGVRVRQLELLLAQHPPGQAVLEALLSDPLPAIRLRVAQALGREGVAPLVALLPTEEGGAAAAALVRLRQRAPEVVDHHDAIVGALFTALTRPAPSADLFHALAMIGTPDIVAPLRGLQADRRWRGATAKLAGDTIRAVQARAPGEHGGVSLVETDGPTGALSEAARPREGGLSESS